VGFTSVCIITIRKLLFCWDKDRKLKEIVLNKKFSHVEHGYDYFCAIDIDGGLNCFKNFNKSHKKDKVPTGFEVGTVHVSIGMIQVCAITKMNLLKCWKKGNKGDLNNILADKM